MANTCNDVSQCLSPNSTSKYSVKNWILASILVGTDAYRQFSHIVSTMNCVPSMLFSMQADIQIWDLDSARRICYHYSQMTENLIFYMRKLCEICTAVHETEKKYFLSNGLLYSYYIFRFTSLSVTKWTPSSLLLWKVRSSYVIYVNNG